MRNGCPHYVSDSVLADSSEAQTNWVVGNILWTPSGHERCHKRHPEFHDLNKRAAECSTLQSPGREPSQLLSAAVRAPSARRAVVSSESAAKITAARSSLLRKQRGHMIT